MTAEGFTAGFALGTGIVLVAGFLGFLVSRWFFDITAPGRRQEITQTTQKTPAEVVREAWWAQIRLWLFIGAVAVGGWFALAANDPAKANLLLRLMLDVLLFFVELLIAILDVIRQLLEPA